VAEPRRRTLSLLLLVVVMVVWGGTYVVTKGGLDELPPMLFALLRFCVASVFLLPIVLVRHGRAGRSDPLPWGTLLLMALTGVALYYVAFNLALSYTSASQGALVQSSIPAVTAVMAALWLGERISTRRQLGLGLAVAGVVLIVMRGRPEPTARAPLLGNLLMFGSVLIWGAYTVLAKRIADRDALTVTAGVSALGAVLLVPAAAAEGTLLAWPSISLGAWLRIVYLGAGASAAGYVLYNRALRDLEASQVGAFINLAPVIGVVSGVVLLGETITPLAVLGGALVLGGLWMSASTALQKG
jgi:drug/metabolite transporter (DMT)-like permease